MVRTIFFSVGEPSGDQHAARLIRELGKQSNDITTRGFGGHNMSESGCKLDLDLTQHAVVGIVEVLPKLKQFFRFVDQAEDIFRQGNIDAVVMVDFPGFNWHIAKRAKQLGIPTYYYCPPQLWAWGGWRVGKMRRTVDHVLSVLPVEERFFNKHDVPTTYVGHPFFDAVAQQALDQDFVAQQTSDNSTPIAVLPGSRGHEVRQNWPLMLEAIRQLSQKHPCAKFLVAAYREGQRDWCQQQMTPQDDSLPIEFHLGKTSEIIELAHSAMMVSGSVSLEMMARCKPAAVIYRVGRVMYGFGKCVIGVDSMTLPNLMGPKKVYPEMVSVGNPKPAVQFLVQTIDAMLSDRFYYQASLDELKRLRAEHAMPGATRRTAEWLVSRLDTSSGTGEIARAA